MNVIKRILCAGLCLSALAGCLPAKENSTLIGDKPGKALRLWYDEPAPDSDFGWANASIPMGNGYMGVNIFGGTATDRIQITENSLYDWADKNSGLKRRGVNNFAEVYIDFEHDQASNYVRDLDLNEGVSSVKYELGGVSYLREYFTSYPDKVMVVRLNASESGKLSFTLRPTIPFIGEGKTGSVSAEGDTVTLSGAMTYYDIKFEGQFKVIPQGGKIEASKGTITVSDADSALILIAVGTNYQFDPQVILT
ncbi:MAG: glycoside hydrolase family 95 protein, partial [Opitutaceae bacterium]